MNAILKEEPSDLGPLVGDLLPSLTGIVLRCLEKPAQARFQTGQDLAFALRSALHGDSGPITRATPGAKSIVVLPFENLSPDPEQDYFADGLTEEIISDLAKLRALRVISRTSAMQLKGTDKDVRTIGRELGVGYVLEGGVRRAGNSLRITAQLIDTATDSHLWAEKYSGTLDDVFEMQEQLSRRIVDALEIELSPQEERRMAERPIGDVQAYEWYLRAREQILRFSEAGYKRALSLIQSAMEITGENELLYATMGHVYAEQVLWGYELDPAYLEKVQRCVDKIFALNPGSAYGHSLQAMIEYTHGNRAAAAALFKRALEDNTGDADALLWLVSMYSRAGQVEAARPLVARLLEIDPLTAANHSWNGWLDLYEHGDTGAFARAAAITYDRDPESPYTRWVLAWALAADGRADEAHPILDLLIRDAPDTAFGRSGRLLQAALRGDREAASEAMTAELESWARHDDVGAHWVAFCHALLGDVETALSWLEIAMERGWVNYPAHVALPFFDGIRDDPRIQQLTKKLKAAWQAFEA
jgi:TolB-like protein